MPGQGAGDGSAQILRTKSSRTLRTTIFKNCRQAEGVCFSAEYPGNKMLLKGKLSRFTPPKCRFGEE